MIISVDTGGTKTLVASFTTAGDLITTTTFPTPRNTNTYLSTLLATLQTFTTTTPPQAIAVAIPGTVQRGTAAWCKNLGWKNFEIKKQLQTHFPDVPIYLENDANLGGLGETRLQQRTEERITYLTISTGIGTGFIYKGAINQSLQLSEGGHMLLLHEGTLQQWEHFASGKAIVSRYQALSSEIHNQQDWLAIATAIAQGLYALIPLTQPEVIIFGGSVGAQFDRLEPPLSKLLRTHLPTGIATPQLVAAHQPHHAVAYGGYFYAINQLAR